jgi:hypothetical protein
VTVPRCSGPPARRPPGRPGPAAPPLDTGAGPPGGVGRSPASPGARPRSAARSSRRSAPGGLPWAPRRPRAHARPAGPVAPRASVQPQSWAPLARGTPPVHSSTAGSRRQWRTFWLDRCAPCPAARLSSVCGSLSVAVSQRQSPRLPPLHQGGFVLQRFIIADLDASLDLPYRFLTGDVSLGPQRSRWRPWRVSPSS